MKFLGTSSVDLLKTSAFVKVTAFTLFSLTLMFVMNHYSSSYSSRTFFSASGELNSSSIASSPERSPAPPPRKKVFRVPPLPPVERMGVLDDNGVMSNDFKIGEFDASLIQDMGNLSEIQEAKEGEGDVRVRVERYKVCEPSMTDYIPCLDNEEAVKKMNSSERGEKYERHCPEEGKGLNCLAPMPKGYKSPIPWPKSRDEVLFELELCKFIIYLSFFPPCFAMFKCLSTIMMDNQFLDLFIFFHQTLAMVVNGWNEIENYLSDRGCKRPLALVRGFTGLYS